MPSGHRSSREFRRIGESSGGSATACSKLGCWVEWSGPSHDVSGWIHTWADIGTVRCMLQQARFAQDSHK